MSDLHRTSVLVTRPAPQASELCRLIREHGGEGIAFPALEIVPLADKGGEPDSTADIIVYTSPNAVRYGVQFLGEAQIGRPRPVIGAIGPSTTRALVAAGYPPDLYPARGFDSEALLDEPQLQHPAGKHVLIVRGEGGREHLALTLQARGAKVSFAEVYKRAKPARSQADVAALEARWASAGIDIVATNSVETLDNLDHMLTDVGQQQLRQTPLVTASSRVAQRAAVLGHQSQVVMSRGPDDLNVVEAISDWNEGRGKA